MGPRRRDRWLAILLGGLALALPLLLAAVWRRRSDADQEIVAHLEMPALLVVGLLPLASLSLLLVRRGDAPVELSRRESMATMLAWPVAALTLAMGMPWMVWLVFDYILALAVHVLRRKDTVQQLAEALGTFGPSWLYLLALYVCPVLLLRMRSAFRSGAMDYARTLGRVLRAIGVAGAVAGFGILADKGASEQVRLGFAYVFAFQSPRAEIVAAVCAMIAHASFLLVAIVGALGSTRRPSPTAEPPAERREGHAGDGGRVQEVEVPFDRDLFDD